VTFLRGGLTDRTVQGYMTILRPWFDFARREEVNPAFVRVKRVRQRMLIVRFLRCTAVDPDRFLPALRWYAATHFVDTGVFDETVIQYARRSARAERVATGTGPARRPPRAPFPYELVCWVRERLWSGTVDDRMVYVGMAVAFNFMLRVSEYAWTGPRDRGHALLTDDVCFTRADHSQQFAWEMGRHPVSESGVIAATFQFRTSKTHQGGHPRVRTLVGDSPGERQLLTDLEAWCRECGAESGQMLFSRWRHGTHRKLRDSDVRLWVREAAVANHIPAAGFSPHSIRVGGATEMSAAGHDDRVIAEQADWRSSRSRLYQRASERNTNPMRVGSTGPGVTVASLITAGRPVLRQSEAGVANDFVEGGLAPALRSRRPLPTTRSPMSGLRRFG
jgi:hypothetical protein